MIVTVTHIDDSLPPARPRGVRRSSRRRLKKWRARERRAGRKLRKQIAGSHVRWLFQSVMKQNLLEGAFREGLFPSLLFKDAEPLLSRPGLMPERSSTALVTLFAPTVARIKRHIGEPQSNIPSRGSETPTKGKP